MIDDLTETQWYLYGAPWKHPVETNAMITIGSPDPHAAIGFIEIERWDPDAHIDMTAERAHELAQYIIDTHNKALKKRQHNTAVQTALENCQTGTEFDHL